MRKPKRVSYCKTGMSRHTYDHGHNISRHFDFSKFPFTTIEKKRDYY